MGESSSIFLSTGDLKLWTIAFIAIVSVTSLIQWLSANKKDVFLYRKSLHLFSIGLCAYVISVTESRQVLAYLMMMLGVGLYVLIKNKYLAISPGRSLGVPLFPIAFGLLLSVPEIDTSYIATSAYILALADSIGGIVGNKWGKLKWAPLHEQKSILGSLSFLIICILLILAFHPFFYVRIGSILIIALLITFAELFSYRGSDNFSVPIAAAILLEGLNHGNFAISQSGIFLLCALLGAPILLKLKWLNLSGILAGISLGLSITLCLPFQYLLFPILFLLLGSLLSRLNPKPNQEKNGRNAVQVLSNAGLAILLAWIYAINQNEIYLQVFLLVFGVALCDTSSSEIGRYVKGKTFDITKFKRIEVGLSGGISLAGSIGGVFVCMLIPLFAFGFLDMNLKDLLSLWLFSCMGMLIDSILGSLFQAKYLSNGKIVEHKDSTSSILVSGYSIIDNHVVNLLSMVISCALYWMYFT